MHSAFLGGGGPHFSPSCSPQRPLADMSPRSLRSYCPYYTHPHAWQWHGCRRPHGRSRWFSTDGGLSVCGPFDSPRYVLSHVPLNHLPLLTYLLLNRLIVVLNRIAEQDVRLHAHASPYRPCDPPLPQHPPLTSPSDENGTFASLGTTVPGLGSPWKALVPKLCS